MGSMRLAVMPPVPPMLAKSVTQIPGGAMSFEPKWDGFRSIIFRDGDEVEIGSRNERPMTRYFPDLVEAVRVNLPERCVVDGEIIVIGSSGDRLDFEVLQQRIHPAASRVKLLSRQTPARFVAFDLLVLGETDYTRRPFAERRAALVDALAAAAPPIHVTAATTDLTVAGQWFRQFEGAGLDGIIAKPLGGLYEPDKRTMFDGHPWAWAKEQEGTRTPRSAETSRWAAGKDLSFTPLRPERVVEVRYDHMEGARFRHTAQFVRWRPDRDPSSCTYEQLDEPVKFDLADVLGA